MENYSRSPRYPAISLPEAVVRLKMFYDSEGTSPADREVIAQSLGYAGQNGASDTIIAALGYYGLLDQAGNRLLRISRLGLDIVLGDPGDPERASGVQEAAKQPPLFGELIEQFPSGKVSNRNLESYLIKNGFKQTAAVKAVKAYRDTIDFVEQETRGLQSTSIEHTQEQKTQPQTSATLTRATNEAASTENFSEQTSDRSTWILPVDDDKEVRLDFRGRLSSEEIETLIEQLQIIQKRIARREQRPPNVDDIPF